MTSSQSRSPGSPKAKKSVIMFLVLLTMVFIGYQLAETERAVLTSQVSQLENNIMQLNAENNELIKRVNQLTAKQNVCAAELESSRASFDEDITNLASCEEQIAFYQHVMAPEISQKMLTADLISATVLEDNPNHIEIELVLLQPRTEKAVISGKLEINLLIEGSVQPVPLANIDYRFKFFHKIQETFVIPSGAVPAAIELKSSVIQYKSVRETFYQQIEWPKLDDA